MDCRKGSALAVAMVPAFALLSSCAPPEPQVFALSVEAHTDRGQALPGVRLWGRGELLGATDGTGRLTARLTGLAGDSVTLTTTCPAGFDTEKAERRIVLGHYQRSGNQPAQLKVRAGCIQREHDLALVVRSRPGVALLVDGQRLGQTNADGIEHLLLRVRPGTRLQLSLDTTAHPGLLPQQPIKTIYTEPHDDLITWDQPLEPKPRAWPPSRRRAPPAEPVESVTPHMPVRIDSG